MTTTPPATLDTETTYDRLAGLPLEIDSHSLHGLARAWSSEFTRRSTVVRLEGAGHVGTLRWLLDAYDHLAAEGIGAYGGGQFELGPGRGQIQLLASLFHPEAPNDVAPRGHHAVEPGLPASPLAAPGDAPGFGWEPASSPSGQCCGPREQSQCCAPSAKSACCGERAKSGTCGCR